MYSYLYSSSGLFLRGFPAELLRTFGANYSSTASLAKHLKGQLPRFLCHLVGKYGTENIDDVYERLI